MAPTRRRVVVGLSVVYLAGLTALAAVALRSTHLYSLPIADVLPALTIALPTLAGVALETVITMNERLAAKGQLQTSRVFQLVVAAFVVYETVLATLAGTHISPPGSLTCALRERWEALFRAKDGDSVRQIQDAFDCCGFNSVRDMAFPFAHDSQNGNNACTVRYERDQACVGPWREEERKVAIMLLVVPLAVFVWKVIIILSPSSASAWLPSSIRIPNEQGAAGGSRRRPVIEYHDVEEETVAEADSLRDEVSRLNNDSTLATHVEGSRAWLSQLRQENNVGTGGDGGV